MKYLIIILCILCAVTLATTVIIWPEGQTHPDEGVVTINDHTLTRQDILDYKDRTAHHGSNNEFIDEIITKQLLIAEAQRRKIDKERTFRLALKTFYEHSLIKILMERVTTSIEAEVTDAEVENYLISFGKTFTFYTLQTDGKTTLATIMAEGKRYSTKFDNLSGQLQQTLAGMEPGKTTTTFVTGNEKIAVHLEKISGATTDSQDFDKEIIRTQLRQTKIEEQVNSWLGELREQASITYNTSRE